MSSRQVSQMLQAMSMHDEVVVSAVWAPVTKLAKLTLIAEQFGFEYADARSGGRDNKTVVLLRRDPSPEAQQRAADTWARYPQAGQGGDLPGMQPGGKLEPLPEAASHCELLKARINFDVTGRNAVRRILAGFGGVTLLLLFQLLVRADEPADYIAYSVIWGFVMLILGAGFLWTRGRNRKYARVLEQSGLIKVTDEKGRARYLPPGSQVPGQMPGQAPGQAPPVPPHPGPYAQPQPAAYVQHQPPQPGAYPQQPQPGPYSQPPQPGPYAQPSQPGPYGQQPGAPQPGGYGQPQPPAQQPGQVPQQGGYPQPAQPGPYQQAQQQPPARS